VLHWDGVLAPGELPVRELSCQLSGYEEVGGDVVRLLLRLPAGKQPRYYAGQYLLLQRADGEWSAFSLASAPGRGRELELHVLAREDSAIELLAHVRRQGFARVQLPFGDTHLAELPDGPLVLVAAGTGMAQMHSLIEYCRAAGFAHPVHLYWGVRRPEDFYRLPHWEEWQGMANLHLHRVVSDVCGWEGRCGLLHEAIREDFSDRRAARLRQRLALDGLWHAGRAGGGRYGSASDARRCIRLRTTRDLNGGAVKQAEKRGSSPAFSFQRTWRCCSSRFL